jgi:hypothetical protein
LKASTDHPPPIHLPFHKAIQRFRSREKESMLGKRLAYFSRLKMEAKKCMV